MHSPSTADSRIGSAPYPIPSLLVAIVVLGTALSLWTAHILPPVQPPPVRALTFIVHQAFPAILILPLSGVLCPSRSTRGPCGWGSQLSRRAEHKVRSHLGTAAASSSRKNRSAQSAGRGWGRGWSRGQGQGWVLPMARARWRAGMGGSQPGGIDESGATAHDPRGSGRLRHTAPTWVTAPGADGASPLHGAAPPGTALGGGGLAGGRTGHLLAQGSGEFPKAPLRQLAVPLEGKGGPGGAVSREREAGVLWSPPAQRREPVLPRACEAGRGGEGGAALSVAGPTAQRVSDCPSSRSSAASPPPTPVKSLRALPHMTSRRGGWGCGGVYTSRGHCVRPLRTLGGSGGRGEGRGRRGVGVCARPHRRGVSAHGVLFCV